MSGGKGFSLGTVLFLLFLFASPYASAGPNALPSEGHQVVVSDKDNLKPSLPESLTVLGKTLVLKDSHDGGPSGEFIAKYIPYDETFDNWTLVFASRFVPGAGLDPMTSAVATANRISGRR
jgi:hypothetical protein